MYLKLNMATFQCQLEIKSNSLTHQPKLQKCSKSKQLTVLFNVSEACEGR